MSRDTQLCKYMMEKQSWDPFGFSAPPKNRRTAKSISIAKKKAEALIANHSGFDPLGFHAPPKNRRDTARIAAEKAAEKHRENRGLRLNTARKSALDGLTNAEKDTYYNKKRNYNRNISDSEYINYVNVHKNANKPYASRIDWRVNENNKFLNNYKNKQLQDLATARSIMVGESNADDRKNKQQFISEVQDMAKGNPIQQGFGYASYVLPGGGAYNNTYWAQRDAVDAMERNLNNGGSYEDAGEQVDKAYRSYNPTSGSSQSLMNYSMHTGIDMASAAIGNIGSGGGVFKGSTSMFGKVKPETLGWLRKSNMYIYNKVLDGKSKVVSGIGKKVKKYIVRHSDSKLMKPFLAAPSKSLSRTTSTIDPFDVSKTIVETTSKWVDNPTKAGGLYNLGGYLNKLTSPKWAGGIVSDYTTTAIKQQAVKQAYGAVTGAVITPIAEGTEAIVNTGINAARDSGIINDDTAANATKYTNDITNKVLDSKGSPIGGLVNAGTEAATDASDGARKLMKGNPLSSLTTREKVSLGGLSALLLKYLMPGGGGNSGGYPGGYPGGYSMMPYPMMPPQFAPQAPRGADNFANEIPLIG